MTIPWAAVVLDRLPRGPPSAQGDVVRNHAIPDPRMVESVAQFPQGPVDHNTRP